MTKQKRILALICGMLGCLCFGGGDWLMIYGDTGIHADAVNWLTNGVSEIPLWRQDLAMALAFPGIILYGIALFSVQNQITNEKRRKIYHYLNAFGLTPWLALHLFYIMILVLFAQLNNGGAEMAEAMRVCSELYSALSWVVIASEAFMLPVFVYWFYLQIRGFTAFPKPFAFTNVLIFFGLLKGATMLMPDNAFRLAFTNGLMSESMIIWFAIILIFEIRREKKMKNETKVWDLFAPVYNVFMRTNRTAYEHMYTNIRAVIKDKRVLEIACGTGLISKNVADAAESYIATDFSENMLKTARKGYVPDNLTFEREDAAFLSFDDDTFDVVIIANALHIIPQPEKVLAEIDRVLKPNGVLIAPNFIHDDSELKSTVMSKVLSAAGITFEAKWNETSYKEFLAENCWNPTFDERLKASIPLMYVQCARASEPSEYMRFDPYLRYAPKPDYKNWVPNGMVTALCAGTGIAAAGAVGVSLAKCIKPSVRKPLSAILGAGAVALGAAALWSIYAHEKFSYKGDRKLSKQIVEGVAKAVKLPENGVALDVGCGSGALTIACAKRNPNAKIIGIDRWGAEYASFSKSLCESNAEAEGVTNVEFKSGNAVKLDFPDETFDAVTSNYVYHNITGVNKQDLLLETLRVLKKGGTFAIHDIMSEQRYGDMWEFADKLIEMGYKDVKLIDTTDGMFMTKCEAKVLGLSGSTLLTGTK